MFKQEALDSQIMKVSDMSSKCIEFENEANSAKEFSISLLKEINELKDEV